MQFRASVRWLVGRCIFFFRLHYYVRSWQRQQKITHTHTPNNSHSIWGCEYAHFVPLWYSIHAHPLGTTIDAIVPFLLYFSAAAVLLLLLIFALFIVSFFIIDLTMSFLFSFSLALACWLHVCLYWILAVVRQSSYNNRAFTISIIKMTRNNNSSINYTPRERERYRPTIAVRKRISFCLFVLC